MFVSGAAANIPENLFEMCAQKEPRGACLTAETNNHVTIHLRQPNSGSGKKVRFHPGGWGGAKGNERDEEFAEGKERKGEIRAAR